MSNCNCSIIRDLLPLYEDRTVSPKTAAIIQKHLCECPECREHCAHIRHVTRAMQNQNARGNYRYSEVVKKIRRNYIIELAAGVAVLSFACATMMKMSKR